MKIIHWNVDTQYDFMRDDESFRGKLPIPSARSIEGRLVKLAKHARANGLQTVYSADWHTYDSEEFSDTPDYTTTFPQHCLQGTKGAKFVPATTPKQPYNIDWDGTLDEELLCEHKNDIVLRKDKFDVFAGNPHTDRVLELLDPDRVVVYGVATNVCVDFAVRGLLDRGKDVYVITDAIKELPGAELDTLYAEWEQRGANLLTAEEYIEGDVWKEFD